MQADLEEGRNVFEEGSNFTLQALEQQVHCWMLTIITRSYQSHGFHAWLSIVREEESLKGFASSLLPEGWLLRLLQAAQLCKLQRQCLSETKALSACTELVQQAVRSQSLISMVRPIGCSLSLKISPKKKNLGYSLKEVGSAKFVNVLAPCRSVVWFFFLIRMFAHRLPGMEQLRQPSRLPGNILMRQLDIFIFRGQISNCSWGSWPSVAQSLQVRWCLPGWHVPRVTTNHSTNPLKWSW